MVQQMSRHLYGTDTYQNQIWRLSYQQRLPQNIYRNQRRGRQMSNRMLRWEETHVSTTCRLLLCTLKSGVRPSVERAESISIWEPICFVVDGTISLAFEDESVIAQEFYFCAGSSCINAPAPPWTNLRRPLRFTATAEISEFVRNEISRLCHLVLE